MALLAHARLSERGARTPGGPAGARRLRRGHCALVALCQDAVRFGLRGAHAGRVRTRDGAVSGESGCLPRSGRQGRDRDCAQVRPGSWLRLRRYDEAWALYEESTALSREIGDTFGLAAALNNMGDVACLKRWRDRENGLVARPTKRAHRGRAPRRILCLTSRRIVPRGEGGNYMALGGGRAE